jgi:hypothetical protein
MNNKKQYAIPQITKIAIDSKISLQMESHEIGTPPTEPIWDEDDHGELLPPAEPSFWEGEFSQPQSANDNFNLMN